MYWNEIKRIASAAGFVVGLITLGVNLLRGHTLLHSTYTAIIMMIASSILFLFCLRGVGNILTTFLLQKKLEADKEKEKRAKELAREKLDQLRERRNKMEGRTREMLGNLTAGQTSNALAEEAEKIQAENQQTEEKLSA